MRTYSNRIPIVDREGRRDARTRFRAAFRARLLGCLLAGSSLATGAAIALRRKFSASNFSKDVREFGATGFLYIG